jgi:AraC-like DNA-binding protein
LSEEGDLTMGKRWDAKKESSLKRLLSIYPQSEAIKRFAKKYNVSIKSVQAKTERLNIQRNDTYIRLKEFYLALGVSQKNSWKIIDFLSLKELKIGRKRYLKRQDLEDKLRDKQTCINFIKSFPWFNITGLYQIIKNYPLCKRIEAIRDNLQSAGLIRHRAVEYEVIYQGDLYTVEELAQRLYCSPSQIYYQIHKGKLEVYRERLFIPKHNED